MDNPGAWPARANGQWADECPAANSSVRARTVRLWSQDGQTWSKGNWLTGLLWVVALAAHLGYDALVEHGHQSGGGVGTATVVLYLAVSLGVQRLVAQFRASRMGLAPVGPPGSGQFS
jgi:hypothetical protein